VGRSTTAPCLRLSITCSIARFVPLTSLEPEVGNDGRSKVPESVQRVGHEEIAQAVGEHIVATKGQTRGVRKGPELPGGQGFDKVLLVKVLVGTSRRERTHSLNGNLPLLLGEELGGLRVVGEVEEDEDSDENSGDTLEDEPRCEIRLKVSSKSLHNLQPLPAVQARLAAHEGHTGRDEASEGTACK
jgi:hypothetical protein